MSDSAARERMVARHLQARGIRDAAVLTAMREVPREAFLPPGLEEFAYEDAPLPISHGQTISQPYIVALMAAALELQPSDRVLEVGTGSGYAAAVLAHLAREVYTVERHAELAEHAERKLAELGLHNVHVRHGDGSLGWPEHAPYQAIVVAAGGPRVPPALLQQLALHGRLVIPVGDEPSEQSLQRIRRTARDRFQAETLSAVRFVPLIGAQGWDARGGGDAGTRAGRVVDAAETAAAETAAAEAAAAAEGATGTGPAPSALAGLDARLHALLRPRRTSERVAHAVARLVAECAEPLLPEHEPDVGALLERIGDSRLVLIGEASHGTSEFYSFRARVTRALIEQRGFDVVAIEADWPDAACVHRYVQDLPPGEGSPPWEAFARFPTWMWRNHEVLEFVEWLRAHNAALADGRPKVGFYGLDLYSLHTSIREVLGYLETVDPAAARAARVRYGCLTPWEADPATYGRAAISGRYRSCEREAVAMLRDLLGRRLSYAAQDGARFLDASRNAQLVAAAERYYRVMYYGGHESWNLRDTHMFETLLDVLAHHGPQSRAVLWEHNSHLGDAAATEPGMRGQINVGQLCRERFGESAFLVGCGTDHGTVAAASEWDGPMEVMTVREALASSFERLFHESRIGSGLLALREPVRDAVREELLAPRLERAIGVIYRPETERQSHYFEASLARQFDEYAWFDVTRAVTPLGPHEVAALPPGHPFAGGAGIG
jgi:protein-L-isoaspartate(D-aspartate) O-methyltransferase